MSKLRKKLSMLLVLCLLVPCISMVAYAAEGVLTFSDPTTKVGETVTVKVKLDAYGSAIGDGDITVTYDKTQLEFVSGENAEGGDGTVKLFATGDGTASSLSYTMEFRALEEGSAKIEVSDYKAYLYDDEKLDVSLGSSLVTIEQGDPNAVDSGAGDTALPTGEGPEVTVNGVNYTLVNDFEDVLIPEGFVRSAFTFEGHECQALKQEASGLYMAYLVDAEEKGAMFLYNPENGEFSACERVRISDTSEVILMQFTPHDALPETYKEAEFELNGIVFPAWQNPAQPEFFIVNAVNTAGYQGYYQYDSSDETYQKFVLQKNVAEQKEAAGFFEKFEEKLKANLSKLLIGVWAVFLVMLIIIITLAVKLKHRNEELDDWYEDFGDQYEAKLKSEQDAEQAAGNKKSYIDDEEIYDDEGDEDLFADDCYDDDYLDDGYEDDYADDSYDEDLYTDDFYDDDYEDYDNDFEDDEPLKDTSDYTMDFIDLD